MRNTTYLKSKSKQHLITHLSPYSYRLTSGSSGNQYIVNVRSDGSTTCSCPYGLHRPSGDKRSLCSHSLAVLNYIKGMEEERTLLAYSSEDEVKKGKRALSGGFDGLILVSRKV